MKEQDILRAIMQETKTGWWEVDVSRRMIRVSEMLQDMLGLAESEISLDDFRRFIPKEYVFNYARFADLFPDEQLVPIDIPRGRVWLSWKAVSRPDKEDGNIVSGYVRVADRSSGASSDNSETERINSFLYRLNSISRTLVSLFKTDDTESATNKILADLLTLFRGSRAYIIRFDYEQNMHVCTHEVTAAGVSAERDFVNFSMDETPWWTDRVSKGIPIVLNTLDELPAEASRERAVLEMQDIKSLIAMPLMSRDKVWGYTGIDIVDRVHTWSSDDCLWFASLVNIIGLCLELQRSEQEAQTERTYLQALYQHMPLGYTRMKMRYDDAGTPVDYRILDVNIAAAELARQPRERYVGALASEVGIDLSAVLPILTDVLRTGRFRERDSFNEQMDRYLHSTFYTIREDEVICLFSDMTEVHDAHELLDRNEKLLRNIFDNMQIGVELYDRNGRLVDINNKDLEIFGIRAKEDVLGVDFYANPNVPQDVLDGVRKGRDQAFRLYYPFDRVGKYYPSGKTGFLEIFSTVNMLYDRHGNVENFMLINIDNTEINRAHTRLAEFESSFSLVSRFGKVGYCRFDLLTKEGYGVPQWYHNLGETEDTPLSRVIGVYSHVHPDDRAAILESIRRVKAGEITSFGHDLRINPGGNETWTRINVMRNPMNNDPAKIEMVCINFDITELKRTEINLIEAKNKAEVSDRLKSAFLANMSHEIRTPLNAIVGFSNLLTETDDIEERREYMHVVSENNDLLLKLISDILDLSKIEAGTFDFNYGAVDVNQMCDEAIRTIGLKVQGRPVELRFGSHEPECRILGDKNRLMQIITNFLNNALKFTEKGSITLGYVRTEHEIRFSVEDTGAGIPRDQLNSVFERFVKLNSFAQGTGLGLSICKSIVEQMGGRIGVESEQGAGSCFWFSIPVGGPSARQDVPPAGDTAIPVAMPGDKRPVLLIAEDTDSNYLLMSLMLKKEYEIIRACNGEEAEMLFRSANPDAILMDIQMPVMDGLEATRRIRTMNTAVPIIAVTAFAYDQDRQRALAAGCTDCLTKPLTGDVLRQLLRTLIRGKDTNSIPEQG